MASRGLPVNPRPRTKSASTPAPRSITSRGPALPSNPRARPSQSQREMVQITIPTPAASRWSGPAVQLASGNNTRRAFDHSLRSSGSSASSSSSSRTWGTSSSVSSRTTLQSEGESYSRHEDDRYDTPRSKDLKHANDHPPDDINDAVGFTWDKVAEVANAFTQEVSKVWATGLNPLVAASAYASKEDESELTRVLRAYHLSKTRDPSDLPSWLFSERERGQLRGLLRPEIHGNHSQAAQARLPPGQCNRLDIHQFATTRNPEPRLENVQKFPTPVSRPPPMKTSGAADRLKIIRERRSAPNVRA